MELSVRIDDKSGTSFAAMAGAFDQTESRGIEVSRIFLRLGGRMVRLRCGGALLAEQFRTAFAHLVTDAAKDSAFDLGIDLWDESVTGMVRPIGDIRDIYVGERAMCRQFTDGVLASDKSPHTLAFQTPRAVSVLNFESRRLVGWVRSADQLSYYEIGKPLQPLLFAWYEAGGVMPIHAGLVAHSGRGFLMGGAGGSGKSTTATNCGRAGFQFLGDDYVGLSPDGIGYSFYATAWLTPEDLQKSWLFPFRLQGQFAFEEKFPVSVANAIPDQLLDRVPIAALLLPRVTGGRSALHRASPGDALLRLAASSILQLPLTTPQMALAQMRLLVHRVPCFLLDLGKDAAAVPDLIAGLRA